MLTWRVLRAPELFPGEDPARSLLALQLFLMGVSIPMLLLGALVDELRHAERTTRKLSASLLRAQDEEQRRIARELHDSTGQNLAAGMLLVGRMQDLVPAAVEPLLRQLEDVLQRSIREVRTASYLLHPPLLDEAGLTTALRVYVDGFVERSEIAVDLDAAQDLGRLPAEVELALFRVVQGALSNVSRHANSPTAQIRLARVWAGGRPNVRLTVEDAGRGMSQRRARDLADGKAREGVGLASMRERLQQIGGRLTIESEPGHTRVIATVPLPS
jgi:signal transduction histidine kinase